MQLVQSILSAIPKIAYTVHQLEPAAFTTKIFVILMNVVLVMVIVSQENALLEQFAD